MNLAPRGPWIRPGRFIGVLIAMMLFGCKTKAMDRFSDLERESVKLGFITAGAARVSRFDLQPLKDLRDKQIQAIEELAKDFKNPYKPENSSTYLSVSQMLLNLSLSYKGMPDSAGKAPEPAKDVFDKLQGILGDLFKDSLGSASEANRIDVTRLRLGYLKYLDSQLESLRLVDCSPVPSGFTRVVLSVELTALVRPEEARGAIVMMDFYPLHADVWAHNAGEALGRAIKNNTTDHFLYGSGDGTWKDYAQRLKIAAFDDKFDPKQLRYFKEADFDPTGWIHHYLIMEGLLPKIVHVEPLDEGELFNRLDLLSDTSRMSTSLGTVLPNISALLGATYASTRANGEQAQRVNPLSLAFAAGGARAGWLFLPSMQEKGNGMKPTERRIKIIVDVPPNLKRVAVHVHKAFTDETLMPLEESSFSHQMAYLNEARHLLSYSEEDYPAKYTQKEPGETVRGTDFKTLPYYELMKSRMRNILSHRWSQALSFTMPSDTDSAHIPAQTAAVQDDGDKSIVTLSGGKTLTLDNLGAVLVIPSEDKTFKFPCSVVECDPAKGQTKLVFPSLKKLKFEEKDLLGMNLQLSYQKETPVPTEVMTTRYIVGTEPKSVGFEMIVGAKQVLVDKEGKGSVRVTFKKPDAGPEATKISIDVVGADVKPAVAQVGETVDLTFSNLSEWTPITITAKNEKNVPHPSVTMRVERLGDKKEQK